MSLNGALQVGRSALMSSQAAIQVAGNNMANAATEGYARRRVQFTPLRGEQVGRNQFVGLGVDVLAIRREVDTALQGRFRDSISQEQASMMDQRFLTSIETLQNELTDNDISSMLSEFFNAFSELANNPEDSSVRSLVIQQGASMSDRLQSMRGELTNIRTEVDRALGASVNEANRLLDRIAAVNREITLAESTAGEASALRDQRDVMINELSAIVDIDVIEQAGGSSDIFIDSVPVVLAGQSRGIELRRESTGGPSGVSIRVAADGTILTPTEGRVGGLLRQREQTVQPTLDALDQFAGQLIFQVNRLHSQGQGRTGQTNVTGTYSVDDTTVNLNNVATGLPFPIDNGSFVLNVTNAQTGNRESYQININGNADSLDDLVDRINNVIGVSNVTASIGPNNLFTLDAAAGFEISFSEDSSGALAALGLNTYFTGSTANDIAVNDTVRNNTGLLAMGLDHIGGSNGTALAISDLQDTNFSELNDRSLREYWQSSVNDLAVRTDAANQAAETNGLVRENLYAQIQGVSGVSLDEESINLLTYQRQFQAAARFISVIDEAMQTLLSIV